MYLTIVYNLIAFQTLRELHLNMLHKALTLLVKLLDQCAFLISVECHVQKKYKSILRMNFYSLIYMSKCIITYKIPNLHSENNFSNYITLLL